MSIERYMILRAELARVRSRQLDSPEEDRLLGEMDDEWWRLTPSEHFMIRSLAQVLRASANISLSTLGNTRAEPASQGMQRVSRRPTIEYQVQA